MDRVGKIIRCLTSQPLENMAKLDKKDELVGKIIDVIRKPSKIENGSISIPTTPATPRQ